MPLLDFEDELPALTFPKLVIGFVPSSRRGQFWSGEFCEWTEPEPINCESHCIANREQWQKRDNRCEIELNEECCEAVKSHHFRRSAAQSFASLFCRYPGHCKPGDSAGTRMGCITPPCLLGDLSFDGKPFRMM
jgi:hypothetical protein